LALGIGYFSSGTKEALRTLFVATLVTWLPILFIATPSVLSASRGPGSAATSDAFIFAVFGFVLFCVGLLANVIGSVFHTLLEEFGGTPEEEMQRVQDVSDKRD